MALVLPDAVRNATDQEEISCPFGTTTFVFQTGPGFEKGALQALSQAFTKVEVVKEKKPGNFDLFIEPAAPDIELQGHCNMFVTEKATLDAKATVTVRVTDRNDQPFLDGTFASSQHTEEKVLDVVGKALADLLQVMAQGLMTTPKLQIYAGVPPSQEPVAPAPPPAPVASVAPSLPSLRLRRRRHLLLHRLLFRLFRPLLPPRPWLPRQAKWMRRYRPKRRNVRRLPFPS